MARGIGKLGHTFLSLSVLAVLSGCGGPATTENPLPSGSSPGGSQPGSGNPGIPNPGGGGNTNPGTTTPPPVNEAIGDPATATANTAVLTTTRTDVYNLNAAGLGASGWQGAELLENDLYTVASSPRVAFDMLGNGFAVWAQGGDMIVRRFSASSGQWGAPVMLDSRNEEAFESRIAVDRQSGNAIAAWAQSNGTANSLYVSSYNASTNTWSAAQAVEASSLPVSTEEANASAVAISGQHAAVAWLHDTGTFNADNDRIYDVYLSRLVAGTWTAPVQLDTGAEPGQTPQIAIDSNGNTTVAWRQFDPVAGEHRIDTRRWNNATQTLGAVQHMDNFGDREPRLQFDAAGNGFLLWRGGGIFASRFDVATGTWGTEVQVNTSENYADAGELSVDENGNAMAAWFEYDGAQFSIHVRRYNAASGSWGTAELLETSPFVMLPTVSVSGNEAVVAWSRERADARTDMYGIKQTNGVWGPVTLLETRFEKSNRMVSTINAAGSAAVVWVQLDGYEESIYAARFQSPNLVVPNGATWQSIANQLYGVNSVEAGNALQVAMGGGPLSAGQILSGFPSTLSVTTNIPPYYTVLATDTWAHIAQRVYGTTDVAAITRLQQMLGTPTLSAGLQLVVPSSIAYTTSANYSAPLDWSRVNTTSTVYRPLNTGALTVPLNNWSPASLLETTFAEASGLRVAFDNSGNGIAVWAQETDVFVSRFSASTASWSAPVALDLGTTEAYSPRVAINRTTGNAVVSFAQSDGVALSMYVSSFTASTNSWSTPMLLENSNLPVNNGPENSTISMAGDQVAVTWLQNNGTLNGSVPNNDIYLSRLVAGTWTAPALVDNLATTGLHPEVAIDSNGNVSLAWRQLSPSDGEHRIFTRRWDNTAQAFGAVTAIDGDGDRQPRLQFDAQGNGIALWRGGIGNGVHVRHYDAVTNTWGPQLALHTTEDSASNGELSVDASGDALATWVENNAGVNTTYARHYDASTDTWGAATAIANMNAIYMSASLVGGSGVVSWISYIDSNGDGDAEQQDVWGVRYQDGAWGTATLLDVRDEEAPLEIVSAIDGSNNATVMWVQADGAAPSVYQARSNAAAYYAVPAGATWQSLANTLYGLDTEAAAQALQTATGNPTLTTGMHLEDLPETLVVTPTVPTHYVIQSGDTWQSITLALYGTNRTEASTALWDALSRPTLVVGEWLLIPSTLEYTIEE